MEFRADFLAVLANRFLRCWFPAPLANPEMA